MTENDFEAFSEMWEACHENYSRTPTPRSINMAFDVLARFDIEQVGKALIAHMNDPSQGQFAPKPADIVRNAEGTFTDAANAAWAKVDHALRRYGAGPAWVFDDARIHAVLHQMGGINQLGKMDEREFGFFREQFCKRYASRIDETSYPRMLAGWYQDGQKALIGDPDKCQQVASGGSEQPVLSSVADTAQRLIQEMRA